MSEAKQILIDESQLRKIFEECKSRDLTQTQFELNKTERIRSFCSLLPSLSTVNNGYTGRSPQQEILEKLINEINSQFTIYTPLI